MSGRCVTASTEIWIVVVMVVILSPPTMSPSALKLTLPPTSPIRMPPESGGGIGGVASMVGLPLRSAGIFQEVRVVGLEQLLQAGKKIRRGPVDLAPDPEAAGRVGVAASVNGQPRI